MTSKRIIGLFLMGIGIAYLIAAMGFAGAFSSVGTSAFTGRFPAAYLYIGTLTGFVGVLMVLLGAQPPETAPPERVMQTAERRPRYQSFVFGPRR